MENDITSKWYKNNRTIIDNLRDYYNRSSINVGGDRFSCTKQSECYKNTASPICCRGSEAYIGLNYNNTKIVIVSLDRGHGSEALEGRFKEIETCITEDKLNNHMDKTLDLLKIMLPNYAKKCAKDGNVKHLLRYFAMTNAAKCCTAQGMNQAPKEYYDNCHDYCVGEVIKLQPNILILQGKMAMDQFYKFLNAEAKKQYWGSIIQDDVRISVKVDEIEREITVATVIGVIHPSYEKRLDNSSKKTQEKTRWLNHLNSIKQKCSKMMPKEQNPR